MIKKVLKKQGNSKMCMVCGMDNPYGLKAPFYELEDGTVASIFKYQKEHQSYPGRVHGGLIGAMLDELACRAFWIEHPRVLAVTIDLQTKYRKPVPYDVTLYGIGKVVKVTSRYFISECQILDEKHHVLATTEAKYLIIPEEQITDASYDEEMCYQIEDDVEEIDL